MANAKSAVKTVKSAKTDVRPAGLKVNSLVVKGLLDANKKFSGTLGIIKDMAVLASADFPKTGKNAEKVNSILEAYKATFEKISPDIKKHFANCLWVLVEPNNVVETMPPKGKSSAVTMTAIEAVKTAGKHTIAKLATEARQANGAGRKIAPKAAPKKPASFYELLAVGLKDKEQLAKIKAVLAKAGYALTPIAKVKTQDKAKALAIIPQANKITDQAAA